ncbi:MAG: hypothetical protein V1728_05520 [Candidatus Micrarchaeota archaeon]
MGAIEFALGMSISSLVILLALWWMRSLDGEEERAGWRPWGE